MVFFQNYWQKYRLGSLLREILDISLVYLPLNAYANLNMTLTSYLFVSRPCHCTFFWYWHLTCLPTLTLHLLNDLDIVLMNWPWHCTCLMTLTLYLCTNLDIALVYWPWHCTCLLTLTLHLFTDLDIALVYWSCHCTCLLTLISYLFNDLDIVLVYWPWHCTCLLTLILLLFTDLDIVFVNWPWHSTCLLTWTSYFFLARKTFSIIQVRIPHMKMMSNTMQPNVGDSVIWMPSMSDVSVRQTQGVPKIPQIPFAFEWQFGQFWKKINIYNFYVYHQIKFICINRPNGNLVAHIKIANIYLFLKLTESQFNGPQIWQIVITWRRKQKPNFTECTNREFIFQLCPKNLRN